MATQNLVSASLSSGMKADVLGMLAAIRASLDFLVTLKSDEAHCLFKAGAGYAPFIDKAHAVVVAHPEIMAGTFNAAEFSRDYALAKDLAAIVDEVNQLAATLNDTLLAANSDAITGALEVYAAVKHNSDRVPGLKVASCEMAEFFKRSRKKETATA